MLITGAAIIAAMIITIIIIYFLILPGYKKKIVADVLYGDISDDVVTETTTEVDNAYAAAELKDEISKYVANYFTTGKNNGSNGYCRMYGKCNLHSKKA